MENTYTIDSILRRKEVCEITGLSKSSLERQVRSGNFPAPIHLTERRIGWQMSRIQDWINSRETVAY